MMRSKFSVQSFMAAREYSVFSRSTLSRKAGESSSIAKSPRWLCGLKPSLLTSVDGSQARSPRKLYIRFPSELYSVVQSILDRAVSQRTPRQQNPSVLRSACLVLG